MTTERLLSDSAPEDEATEPTVLDEAPREGMTPTEWAAGIRRLRRSTIVHDTGHLLADFDELGYRIEHAPADADVDDLIDRYEALAEQIKGGVRYVAEQRSVDWSASLRTEIMERHGFTTDTLTDEQALTIGFEVLAAQIVEPEGVTADTIRRLHETAPAEADKIAGLVHATNTTRIDSLESRDFSSRRSDKKSTKASSGR